MEGRVEVVRFRAAGFAFAIEAHRVLSMRTDRDAAPIEAMIGLDAPSGGSRKVLDLRGAEAIMTVSVADPVTLSSFPAQSIQPLPPLVAERMRLNGVRALARLDGVMVMILGG